MTSLTQTAAAPSGNAAGATSTPKPKPQPRRRYPPLVVEKLPAWPTHFRALRDKLGHPPNARPYQGGVRFTPQSDEEFRVVQRYLTGLEKEIGLSWFAYSLPAERSVKVALRGLPADTPPEEIEEELRTLGHQPEYVRHIKARAGRPGCVFHVVLKRTPDIRTIYDTSVFLNMRGVKVEAWRSKRGPAQCHRCQKFRHSSHHCHRTLACVRCGGEHAARDCPRPREEPATCANCGGDHPASHVTCPVFKAEARHRRAGTVATTTATGRSTAPIPRPEVDAAEAPGASLMATANGPSVRGDAPPSKRRKNGRKKKKKRGGNQPAPPPAPEDVRRGDLTSQEAQAVPPPPAARPAGSATVAQPPAPPKPSLPPRGAGEPAAASAERKQRVTACAIRIVMRLLQAIREEQDAQLVACEGLAELLAIYSD